MISMVLKDRDVLLPFSFNKANIRGKILRLTNTSKQILDRFDQNDSINEILLEALSLSQIIAHNFKFEGTFKLQLNCYEGLLKVILCDVKHDGSMRAFISLNEENTTCELGFKEIIGKGFMIFHMNMIDSKHAYQAVVELIGNNLSEAAQIWFEKSEQIQTFIKIFSCTKTKSTAGLFLQRMPNQYATEEGQEEQDEIFNTVKILSETISKHEILNDSLEEILYKLYHEFDVLIFEKQTLCYKCSCSKNKISEVIEILSEQEKEDIKKENQGNIKVECSFCGERYLF